MFIRNPNVKGRMLASFQSSKKYSRATNTFIGQWL
jgi:hypothetical protein